jgi:hypothetical protein
MDLLLNLAVPVKKLRSLICLLFGNQLTISSLVTLSPEETYCQLLCYLETTWSWKRANKVRVPSLLASNGLRKQMGILLFLSWVGGNWVVYPFLSLSQSLIRWR